MSIPSLLLKRLYTFGTLQNSDNRVCFSLKNRLNDTTVTNIIFVKINGEEIPMDKIWLDLDDGKSFQPQVISDKNPIDFPLRKIINFSMDIPALPLGNHDIHISFQAKSFGKLKFKVKDAISEKKEDEVKIPRDNNDDFSPEIIKKRQKFVEKYTGAKLNHLKQYSFDPHITEGNCEHFTGIAQVPIGIAGPITIDGEHAKGDFLIPMATAEGTLVASYNRGIKIVNLSGGVKCTVVEDAMQRAPVFAFDDAREAREFVVWIKANMDKIREEAEATSSVAKLLYIQEFLSNKFVYLRFNFSTGDAAGQNMVGRATFAASSWIVDNYPQIRNFFLESNFATDKKASQINIMKTRGKRVTAELTIPRDVLIQNMRVKPEQLAHHAGISNVGSFMSGANNNGLHSANGITAMFIATGQDVANVSESSAGIIYTELTEDKDL